MRESQKSLEVGLLRRDRLNHQAEHVSETGWNHLSGSNTLLGADKGYGRREEVEGKSYSS